MAEPLDFLPARRLPLFYLGAAHLSLLAACLAAALDPRGVAGFYYGPKVVAIGISELRSAWLTTARRNETPLATAVRM